MGADRTVPTSTYYDKAALALARNLRVLRARQRWTQEDAAHETGLPLRVYQRIETGECNPTLRTLARMAAGLRVELRDLFGEPQP